MSTLKSRFSHTASGQNVESTLRKIQSVVDGKSIRQNLCHGRVGEKILKRKNPLDRVYLFGTRDLVLHSILISDQGKLLMDTFSGEFDPTKGYFHNEEWLPICKSIRANYFLLPDEYKPVTLDWLSQHSLKSKVGILNLYPAMQVSFYTGKDLMGSVSHLDGDYTFVKSYHR